MNILVEFEKRYKGNVRETKNICAAIAQEFGLDVNEVEDYVYIHRYEDNEPLDKLE